MAHSTWMSGLIVFRWAASFSAWLRVMVFRKLSFLSVFQIVS